MNNRKKVLFAIVGVFFTTSLMTGGQASLPGTAKPVSEETQKIFSKMEPLEQSSSIKEWAAKAVAMGADKEPRQFIKRLSTEETTVSEDTSANNENKKVKHSQDKLRVVNTVEDAFHGVRNFMGNIVNPESNKTAQKGNSHSYSHNEGESISSSSGHSEGWQISPSSGHSEQITDGTSLSIKQGKMLENGQIARADDFKAMPMVLSWRDSSNNLEDQNTVNKQMANLSADSNNAMVLHWNISN